MTERALIERIRRRFPRTGDDAAVVGGDVITTDMLIEDVDFSRAIPQRFIARKSLTVNLSDLAAMGATPSHAVVAIGAPDWADVDALLDAMAEEASEYGIEIVGGDLSRAEKLVIAITAVGHADRPILRSGAHAGERIYVSRPIGGSAAGLALLQRWSSIEPPSNIAYTQREFAASAIRRHIDPEPEVTLGIALAAVREVSACIDISDGLSTDLHNLCDASNCGAAIERERIPLFPDLLGSGTALGLRAQDAVMHGGEEYALLFTSSLRESELSARVRRPVYAIGRVTARESGVTLNGEPLEAKGWDHFA
jgi:thiamine-monophosphate kinase